MIQTARIATMAVLAAASACVHAPAQEVVRDVDVENRCPFPIVVRRMGLAAGDMADYPGRPGERFTLPSVHFRGDQVFVFWADVGSGKCLGSCAVRVQTAVRDGIGMIVTQEELRFEWIIPDPTPGDTANRQQVAQLGAIILKLTPDRPKVEGGRYAENLGIRYKPISYTNGTIGAIVIDPPAAGTPAAELGLEVGDVVFAMDGQTFGGHQDVLAHRGRTSVDVVNVRTGAPQSFNVDIP